MANGTGANGTEANGTEASDKTGATQGEFGGRGQTDVVEQLRKGQEWVLEEVVEDGTTVQTKQDGAEEDEEGGVGGGFAGWHVFYGNRGVYALVLLVLPLVIADALVVLVAIFVLVLDAATVLMEVLAKVLQLVLV